jgi:hypothetical protein
MRLNKTSALLLGALAAVASVSVVFAAGWRPPPSGSWQCFRTDRFPDLAHADPTRNPPWDPAWAASDPNAQVFAGGLNQVARNSPAGTVLPVQIDPPLGSRYPVICVKY